MHRKKVLMLGASVLVALGLSACSNAPDPSQQKVLEGLKAKANANAAQLTPTEPDHEDIKVQLNRIESKLSPVTKTKTVTPTPSTTTTTKTTTTTTTVTVTPTTTTPPPSTTTPAPPPGTQTLGVGGVATPPDAIAPAAGTTKWAITTAGVYDCKGATVGWIEIKTNGATVQNCKIVANSQYGIYSSGNGNTIQNNDIKGLKPTGDGDMNAITFFGNDTTIAWNTAIDFVAAGDPGSSHTDFIQTWVSTNHPTPSSNVVIRSNKATGPANPQRLNSIPSIHQCVMVEDQGMGGNAGGETTGMKNWLLIANTWGDSWNQCIKNDGVDGMVVTKNDFQGSSSHVMEQASGIGLQFFSDNIIGPGYGNVGVPITLGAGPI